MLTLVAGVGAAVAVWYFSKLYSRTDAAAMARALKVVGGVVSAGATVVLAVRGRFDMALLVGSLSAWLLGWSVFKLPGLSLFGTSPPGSVSRVRSAMIEMELDHATGAMDGSVLAGSLMSRRLGELDETALRGLHEECRAGDPDGVRLLDAYLHRRFAGWRQHAEADPDARVFRQPGALTEQEAYEILGLAPGAGPDEVRRAHRTLMKKLHPDQGGSTYLAVRVNQAKDVLLSRHR